MEDDVLPDPSSQPGHDGAEAAAPVNVDESMLADLHMHLLLPFQRELVSQLVEEDGLCVMAQGLGWQQVVGVLLRLQEARLRQPGERGVVLVVGATDWQREALRQELRRIDPEVRRRYEDMVSTATAPPSAASTPAITTSAARAVRLLAEAEVPAEVTNEVPALDRLALYRSKGSLFVTTRILVVDLLTGRLRPQAVAGMVVLNAHRVSGTSGEGFAARLYRAGNPRGFIRALSDAPTAFNVGFNKLEKVMKALHLGRLFLWPRYQMEVKDCLAKRAPELVEVSQPLSPSMTSIYDAIAELMDVCIKELKRTNRALDSSDLSLQAGLFRSFDETVRRQLEPVWHTVSPKTKQLVSDLRTLRELAGRLLRLDAVTFLQHLDNLRASEGVRAVWLMHTAAHIVYEEAKRRVYSVQHSLNPAKAGGGRDAPKRKRDEPQQTDGGTAAADNAGAGSGGGAVGGTSAAAKIEPVLEALPKWALLREVLDEIQQERLLARRKAAAAAGTSIGSVGSGGGNAEASCVGNAPVLVWAQERHTCLQLREVLKEGGQQSLMSALYQHYLLQRLKGRAGGGGRGGREGRGGGRHSHGRAGRGQARHDAALSGMAMRGRTPGEDQALLKEAQAIAKAREGARKLRARAAAAAPKARSKGGMVAAQAAGAAAQADAAQRQQQERGERQLGGGGSERQPRRRRQQQEVPAEPAELESDAGTRGGEGGGADGGEGGEGERHHLLRDVEFIALEERDDVALWRHCPAFVVLYDPDVALVRQLELYRAGRPGLPLRVYLLRYEDSMESDRFQAALDRERRTFESLIRQKEFLLVPMQQQGQAGAAAGSSPAGSSTMSYLLSEPGVGNNAATRRAGGRAAQRPQQPPRLVVDVREFMSALPCVLHQAGMQIVPVTLEVGDYVLSPEICVERKSLPDLRGSLQSGRLFHQAEAMCKHYKNPVLLIEFEGDKAFMLQSPAELGSDISSSSMSSRLTLLCLHFPRLRLIWSRSLHATADIFRQLKSNQDEPDAVTAAAIGVPVDADGMPEGGEAVVNQPAIDLLRRLPGVTEGNFRNIMRHCGSLAGLAATPLDRLAGIMGGRAAAEKLHGFLNESPRALWATM